VTATIRIASHPQLKSVDSLSRSQRERLVKDGRYPRPVQLSERRVGFVLAEVEEWCRARVAARDGQSTAPESDSR